MLRSSVRTARVRRALATLAFWLVVAVSLSFSARERSADDSSADRALRDSRGPEY